MTDARCVLPHHRDPERPRRALDGAYVCAGCNAKLWRHLTELAPLHTVLGWPTATAAGPKVSGTPQARLVVNPKNAAHRREIHAVLALWARNVADERGLVSLPADTVPAIVDWLARHHAWLCSHPAVDDYAAELAQLHRRAWSLAYPTKRHRVDVGACPLVAACDVATRAELRCPGRIVATLRLVDDLLPAELVCTACGTATPPHAWPALGRRLNPDRPAWLTAVQVAELWNVPLRTVQRYALVDAWPTTAGWPPRYDGEAVERSVTRESRIATRREGHAVSTQVTGAA